MCEIIPRGIVCENQPSWDVHNLTYLNRGGSTNTAINDFRSPAWLSRAVRTANLSVGQTNCTIDYVNKLVSFKID